MFECNGEDITLMRWTMEPFIPEFDPAVFTPADENGKRLSRVNNALLINLTSISSTPDNAIANMTSTLTFIAMETMINIPLNGTVIMCNEESTTLLVIKGILSKNKY